MNKGGWLMVSKEVRCGFSFSLIGSVSWWILIVSQVLGFGVRIGFECMCVCLFLFLFF